MNFFYIRDKKITDSELIDGAIAAKTRHQKPDAGKLFLGPVLISGDAQIFYAKLLQPRKKYAGRLTPVKNF